MIMAAAIIVVWTRTAYEQFTFLAGITAPTEFVNLVTYKVRGKLAALMAGNDIQ